MIKSFRYGLVVSVWLVVLFASRLSAGNVGGLNINDLPSDAPEGYESTEAFVVFDSGYAKWEAKHLRFQRHMCTRVLSDSVSREAGRMVVEFADYDHLKRFQAHVYHADGSADEYRKKAATKTTYGDVVVLELQVDSIRKGDVVEWYYEIEYYGGYDDLGPMKLLHFAMVDKGLTAGTVRRIQESLDREYDRYLEQVMRNLPVWFFDGPFYTMESTLKVDLMTRINYSYFPANLPVESQEPAYDEDWLSGYKYYTWTIRDVAPVSATANESDLAADRVALFFAMLSTTHGASIERKQFADDYWANIGYGLKAFLTVYCDNSRPCRKQALKLTEGLVSDHAKLDSVYQFVAREYRPDHPLLELRPQQWNVAQLFKKKNGSGFEINVLLLEMLQEAGLEAWPMFISTRGKQSFRDVGHFNHMIVLASAGGEGVFLDACLGSCAPGSLPLISSIEEGLLIGEDGLTFVTVVANECSVQDSYHEFNVP